MRFQTPAGKEGVGSGGQGVEPVSRETRETIARLRNCIVALAREKVLLFDTTIQYTYDASLKYEVGVCCDMRALICLTSWTALVLSTVHYVLHSIPVLHSSIIRVGEWEWVYRACQSMLS